MRTLASIDCSGGEPIELSGAFERLFELCVELAGDGVVITTRCTWEPQRWRVLPYYRATCGRWHGGGRSPEQAMRNLYGKLLRRIPLSA